MILLRYNLADFYGNIEHGVEFKGPAWDPIRVFANLTTWNMFVIVPIFYGAIFKFRRRQDMTPGKYIWRVGIFTFTIPLYGE